MLEDSYHLHRFVELQDPVYDQALAILKGGAMCTAYMDFIFPRLAGIYHADGRVALRCLDEARAYLFFPILGDRYRECVDALFWLADASPVEVFGAVDARKLQASLTLFSEATNELLMRTMLTVWFDSRVDENTITHLDLRP